MSYPKSKETNSLLIFHVALNHVAGLCGCPRVKVAIGRFSLSRAEGSRAERRGDESFLLIKMRGWLRQI